ncbi:mechanosensitive ion channel protein [Psychrosphaera saromensis]|uniref:Small-conductance mechanosensitive channel n=1 Tax=Psychrosphaera saromensis TaxID=716813 RepID=A0A2S7UR39_9GAMM|nr:mechanosensitive ion channel domain-containing protein [Psychrosphaera saromensis]PQJ52205.1 mechanosensitive ion channel protein MscS [Psychrosphaera saromensis]GHB79172.1 mechanosensitive ion channel protein [Psychrosphaera saromensis]GLQ13715.1 mechanosensitive ion channel protein [Psychrosphaera saromensis]
MDPEVLLNKLTELVLTNGPNLLAAIAVLFIGSWVIKAVVGSVRIALDKGSVDPSLKPFLLSMLGMLLKVMLFISVLGMLGIEMTSFIAILGAAGLAVGMALSGTLQNFAGGVMILLFKPFKVGDVIEAQGYVGSVAQIQIFNTILKTPDNKTIIIPNGGLSTSSMINYSTEEKRRVDWTIGVAYGDDLDKARQVIKQLCDADERILKDPEVFIAVSQLADSSVNFAVRAWVKAPDYWGVYFDMNENVYKTFGKEGLNIPFPQMDVHLHK